MNVDLSPERWRLLETLFYKATDMEPRDRAIFLDQACAGDVNIRKEVDSLLAAADQTLSYLHEPASEAAREMLGGSAFAGKLIGHWRIVQTLGDGGMGKVCLATRADEVYQQNAALKLMRADLVDSPDMLVRFRIERQILAKLNHPNIARLLDGGVSPDGLPYLVMEYVEGVPIDVYCRDQGLSVEDRLRLFRTVCEAVEYAHHNLVIHRDIKPANILVTAAGVPKLLDFGIARFLDPEFSPLAKTRASERLMTPDYASPEQVRGEVVTTASDVYSMGVLLYELLAGKRPFRIRTDNPLEIARAICEQTPDPPSAAGKPIHSDLDKIVMMAIRKEPQRRYASVEQLSADVHAYLEGYPLHARTDSWGYRSTTFIRRHKAGVTAAALFALALAGFGVGMGILAKRADRQRQTAERASQFMADMFRSASPDVAQGETITARMLLDRGAQRVDQDLASEPQVRASMLETIAHAYRSLGLYDQSLTLAQRALDLSEKSSGASSPETIKAVELLAELQRDKGKYSLAEPLLQRVLKSKQAAFGVSSPEAAAVMAEIGECFYWEAKDDAAIDLLRRTLAIDRKNGPDYGASTRDYLALSLERKGGFDEARQLLQEAVDIERRTRGTKSPEYAIALHNLGSSLIDRGDLIGAEAKIREALDIRRIILGPDHPDMALSLNNLGYVLLEQGEWHRAEPILKEALEVFERRLGPSNPRLAAPMNNWARFLQAKGDYAQAEADYNRILELLKQANAAATWPAAQIIANRGLLHFDRGNYASAEQDARQAQQLRRKLGGEATVAYAASLIDVAEARAFQGDLESAEPLLRSALEIRKKQLWSGHPSLIAAQVRLGEVLVAERKSLAAEPLLHEAALAVTHVPFPLPAWQVAEAKNAYGECLKSLGRITEAEPLLRESGPSLAADPRPAFRTGVIASLLKRRRS